MTEVPHTVQCLWCEEYRTEVIQLVTNSSTHWDVTVQGYHCDQGP